jgi:hypothetical protein
MIERDNVDRGVEIALRAGERGGGVSGSKTRGGGHERVNYSERVWMYMSCDAMLSRRGLYRIYRIFSSISASATVLRNCS